MKMVDNYKNQEELILVEYLDNPHWRWFGDKPNIKTTTATIKKTKGE